MLILHCCRTLEASRPMQGARAGVSAGRMELHLESFRLAPLIEDVGKTIEPIATKNGNRIVVDCPTDLGTIHADQTRFRQSLLNLASNANKFTEKGTITIAAHGERLRLDHSLGCRYRHRNDGTSTSTCRKVRRRRMDPLPASPWSPRSSR